jgi:HEAT repeat protein
MSQSRPPLEQLLGALGATRARVRASAAKGLGACGDTRAVEPLVHALGDRTVAVRFKAAAALGQLRDPRAIPPLIVALEDLNAGVRHAAAGALKKFGRAAYAPLLEAYKTGDAILRFVALSVLARSRSAATSELLIAALDDPALPVRMEATRLLGQRKERKAVERLIAALDQPDFCLWLYAWALGEIGDPRAFEPLAALLDARDFHVQSAVVKALRTIDNARAVDLLSQRLEDPACANCDQLAKTLANMDLLDAIHGVFQAAAGGNRDVLRQAQTRLRSAQDQMRACAGTDTPRAGGPAGDWSASQVEQARVTLMRQLESELRALSRGPGGFSRRRPDQRT